MSKHSTTYGELFETLVALAALLGLAVCLQTGLFSSPERPLHKGCSGEEQLCCAVVDDFGHDHTDTREPREPVFGAGSSQLFLPKMGPAPASMHLQVLLHSLPLHQEVIGGNLLAALPADRHILFRCLRI